MRQLAKRESPPSLFEMLIRRVRDLAGRGDGEANGLRDAFEELIAEADEEGTTSIGQQERELIRNALSFGELRVDDVMVPRADIKGVEVNTPLDAVVRAIQKANHSRLIVYRNNLDDVVGMVHIKDLLPFWGTVENFSLEQVTRSVLVVPPSMRVLDLLREMRTTHSHLAVVVDEFGGTDGLVTIEDLAAQIMGELQDEHDQAEQPQIVENPDGSIDAEGRADLEELEERLGVELLGEEERDEADTLGGLIFTLVDRVPTRGEIVHHPRGLQFEVLDADPRRIKRVRIRPARPQPSADEADTAH